jgi:hypothetical protein
MGENSFLPFFYFVFLVIGFVGGLVLFFFLGYHQVVPLRGGEHFNGMSSPLAHPPTLPNKFLVFLNSISIDL